MGKVKQALMAETMDDMGPKGEFMSKMVEEITGYLKGAKLVKAESFGGNDVSLEFSNGNVLFIVGAETLAMGVKKLKGDKSG